MAAAESSAVAAAAETAAAESSAVAAAAGSSPSTLLFKAAAAGDEAAVQDALQAGADVTWADEEGTSALMTAAENGHLSIVHTLLEAGAPWNQQDSSGYCAGEYAGKHQDIAELLMEWGVQAELMLMAAERDGTKDSSTSGSNDAASSSHAAYLKQKLVYTPEGDKLLDADGEAVMMGWEAPLMEQHAAVICGGGGGGGGHYLNVGFGLGIIDTYIQGYHPSFHTIIEAHPDVYAHMLSRGWDKKPGVRILFGRWQDVLGQLEETYFDGIFFDTYGEYYSEGDEGGIRTFHEAVPKLLRPGGIYSYFNGFASDNLFFHMVYGRVVQSELVALGLSTSFKQLRVAELGDDVWQGVRNKYWKFPVYFLPTVKHAAGFVGDAEAPGEQLQQEQRQAGTSEAL